MKKELQDKLYKEYPKIFAQKDFSPQRSCMCFGIACGDGWYNILNQLCFEIQDYIDQSKEDSEKDISQVEATQVKEKFGGLRFYYDGGDEFVDGLIRMAESMSYVTCEHCGSPGNTRPGGYIVTLCDTCVKKK